MKKLLLLLSLLLLFTTINATEKNIQSVVIVNNNVKLGNGFYSIPKHYKYTMKQKVIHCIIAEAIIFAIGEYAIKTRNAQLWNADGILFVASIPANIIYLNNYKRPIGCSGMNNP